MYHHTDTLYRFNSLQALSMKIKKKEEGKNRNISKLLNTHAICYLDIQSFKVLCICRKSFLYVSSKNIYPIQ